jgi:tricorn protease
MNKIARVERTYSAYLFVLVLIFTTYVRADHHGEVYFMSHPAVSPDGSTVIFSFEGDLWKVPVIGGTAVRLTGMEGVESHPRFSPDGRWLAFTGRQDGNAHVYVMPVEGGEIRRLTYHDGDNLVNAWSWDSQTVYFSSDRYNYISSYAVSIDGGTPVRLFGHFFNLPHDIIRHPVTGDYYFTDTWESFRFIERKNYRGAFSPDIKSYNPETDEYTVHTDWDGKDLWPMIDREGNIYYVSDQLNGEYNIYRLNESGAAALTAFDTSVKRPQLSADGSVIVFEKDYRLYRYNTATGETSPIPVRVNRNFTLDYDLEYDISGKISFFDVASDNKKIAFVSRGELFVSDVEGKFIRRLETEPRERVVEVRWLQDNKTLIYTQTADGSRNIFRIAADGSANRQRITDHRLNDRNLTLNTGKNKMAFFSGRSKVNMMDLQNYTFETLVEDELWAFRNESLMFSPDDNYLAFNVYRNFEQDIMLYDLSKRNAINITQSGVSEMSPFWSSDGKYLYFASDRVQPSYPRGNISPDIYRIAFDRYREPFRSERFGKLFTEENDTATKSGRQQITVDINFNDLHRRWEKMTSVQGTQHSPYVVTKDDEHTILYISNHDGSGFSIWKTELKPFESAKTEKFKNAAASSLMIREADGKYYTLIGGRVHTIDIASAEAKPIEMSHTFHRNLKYEFEQMFFETWANLEENFYDDDMHGVDWHRMRDHYAGFLPYLNTREDLRILTNDMLGELGSSHMGFSSRGDEEETVYGSRTNATGIVFENTRPFTVERIVRESSANRKEIDIRPGDVLTAVNGRPVDPNDNREKYFLTPSLQTEMELTFRRGGNTFSVLIRPQSSNALQMHLYDEWIDRNQQRVAERTGNRVAYIHMKNMGAGELQQFQVEIARQLMHSDALIFDIRNNRGGNVHDDVLQLLSRRQYLTWRFRGGEYAPQPNFTPADIPVVLLMNEQSLSDAEMTAIGFKELGLGTVIGTETYRWIIFTTGEQLVDGSFHRLPAWGCFTPEGENMEKTGVSPDIYVDKNFKDRLHGNDPQLDRAIEEVMQKLD